MKTFILVILGVCLTSQVFAAGSLSNVKVIYVRVDSSGKGMVYFDRPLEGTPPSCVIGAYANALAFNGDSGGKAVLAMALAAKASDSPITVYGLGTCSNFGSYVEDWNYGLVM